MELIQIATANQIVVLETKIDQLQKQVEELINSFKNQSSDYYLRQQEVMELLKVSENTLRKYVASGHILRIEIAPKLYRFPLSQFKAQVTLK